jgi:glycosyltransferase involved in cell wall biosynthesis
MHHQRLARVQVSHAATHDYVLSRGVAPDKVFRIPIGVDVDRFPTQSPHTRERVRRALDIPLSAVVVGSFQKDGVGWGEGMQPKLVKGPDVLLEAIAILRHRVRELFVLLSGPARGFVRAGLERLGVPYRHVYVPEYSGMGELYQALDVYLVTSREEGGPKAVLESMSAGVALVSTRVGQATDLVEHGSNGWLTDIEDAEALAHWASVAVAERAALQPVLQAARHTAVANSYENLTPRWKAFFHNFVESS